MATIALQRVANPLEFGVVVTGEDGRITRFLEKPSWGEIFSDTINTGIYVLEPEVFEYMETGKNYDFSRDIFPLMLRDGRALCGHVCGRLLERYRQLAAIYAGELRCVTASGEARDSRCRDSPGRLGRRGRFDFAGRARARAGRASVAT